MYFFVNRPFADFGQQAHRLLLTLKVIKNNIMLVILGLCAFSVSFNHMHHRRASVSTYDSLYGSFIQTTSYALGGFTVEFLDEADNALFMSFVFMVFVFVILLVLVVILIASAVDAYSKTAKRAMNLWRMSQTRIILKKASLLSPLEASQSAHTPKWLHMLAPAGYMRAFKTSSGDDDDRCTNCQHGNTTTSAPGDVTGNAAVVGEIESLRELVLQLSHRIDGLGSATLDYNEISNHISNQLKSDLNKSEPVHIEKVVPKLIEPESVEIVPNLIEPESDATKELAILKPNDPTGNIRVRQIKASKKRLSRLITGESDDEGSSSSRSPMRS